MKKILILGGGFAGIQTAIELQKKGGFEVTLVSDRDYLYLYPISIWVPVHKKEFDEVIEINVRIDPDEPISNNGCLRNSA